MATRPMSGGIGLARRACIVLAWAVLALAPCRALAQGSPRPAALDAWAQERLAEILTSADADENADLGAVRQELSGLFDALIAYGDERRVETWVETDEWLRLAAFFEEAPDRLRGPVWRLLRAHPTFAANLAFILCDADKPAGVANVSLQIAQTAWDLDEFASLAAAVCVVHDEEVSQWIGRTEVKSPPAQSVYAYFASHERQLLFGTKAVPPEILVYVVDVICSVEDLEWALNEYKGDRHIGERYGDIEYDYAHFRRGEEKKAVTAGYTLPNIARVGGVCAEQAYFAMSCGKAIGVPTAYVWASNAEVAHAWVGYVVGKGSRAEWNFENGHYDAYRGVKGNVMDPQRRQWISEGELAFLAESITEPGDERRAAATLTQAAARLVELEASSERYPPPYPLTVETSRQLPRTRPPTLSDALDLLETGLKRTPGYRPGWEVLRKLAAEGRLSHEQKQDWAKVLDRLTGSTYPDFTLSVLRPMIDTVSDPEKQMRLWERALRICSGRADLSAEIRMAQGTIRERQNEQAKAWACYQEVIQRYANEGPFVIDALKAAERMLRTAGKLDQITSLYEDAWERMHPPQQMAEQFMRQSNYFRVGVRYAQLLEQAGRTNLAAGVRGKIGVKGSEE